MKPMQGQLSLDLTTVGESPNLEARCFDWLRETHGVGDAGIDMARRLFAEFGQEAFERCKAIPALDGKRRADGFTLADADLLGVFDASMDYHAVWDRAWAARQGLPKRDIVRLVRWDYGAEHPTFEEET